MPQTNLLLSALEPPSCWILLQIPCTFITPVDWLYGCLLILLLFLSAFFSGSETAFFSLSPQDIDRLKREDTNTSRRVLKHLSNPDRLLGTLLLGNNFVNVAIVLLSTVLMAHLLPPFASPVTAFLVQTVCVTFLLLLFGEVLPKTFATQYALGLAKKVAAPLIFITQVLHPFTWVLRRLSTRVHKSLSNVRSNVSIDELSQAVDLAEEGTAEDKEMLKGIVRFVNIDVRQVMCPRVQVDAVEISMDFSAVRSKMIECGYSRIPVYDKTPDHVKGILFVKDLMPHLYTEDAGFNWQSLIRDAYFVPENKKINDLLEDFRRKKMHMAVVVDEYGGTEGIVTLEDILEEIVGEIGDETD